MTAIDYKDGILAADSLITEDDFRFATAEKVRVLKLETGVWLIGMAGTVANFTAIANFLEDFITQSEVLGLRGAALTEEEYTRRISREFDVKLGRESGSVILVKPSGDYSIFNIRDGFDGHYERSTRVALGVAREYVTGAMDAGKSASDSVLMACLVHGSCGKPVRVYRAGKGEVLDFPYAPV